MNELDDNIVNDGKRQKREKYLDDCLQLFCNKHYLKIVYTPHLSKWINTIYWESALKHIKNLMDNPEERVDHHKIIAGTQCAIMASCVLRTEDTIKIKLQGKESKEIDSIRAINADFALYIAFDILEQWNGIDITPLKKNIRIRETHSGQLSTSRGKLLIMLDFS